jgi:hypothetical protein
MPDRPSPSDRADRLNALVKKACPKAHADYVKTGRWPVRPEKVNDIASHRKKIEDGQVKLAKNETLEAHMAAFEAPFRESPFVAKTIGDKIHLILTQEDGDVRTGVGDDFEGALKSLEAKLS